MSTTAPAHDTSGTNKQSAITSNADAYPLGRNALASTRLHLQHNVWIKSTGFHLHPSIPRKDDMLVAEVGCGNGIWTLETADLLPPMASIDAFDLSLEQAPPKHWWPSNATFTQRDIFAPIPTEMQGRYDVVHIRLFLCVVQGGDPMPLLRNLMLLLKPGGHLQWQEFDPLQDKVLVADPTASAPKLKGMRESLTGVKFTSHAADRVSHDWVGKLHMRFHEAGGQLLVNETRWTAPSALLLKQETQFLAVWEWTAGMRASCDLVEYAEMLEEMEGEVEKECWMLNRGTLIDSAMVTWVVRKE